MLGSHRGWAVYSAAASTTGAMVVGANSWADRVRPLARKLQLAKPESRVKSDFPGRVWLAQSWFRSLHSATTAHLTCTYALRVAVNIHRRSEWWRSATLTVGPRASLPSSRQSAMACLVGLRRSPVSTELRQSISIDPPGVEHPSRVYPWILVTAKESWATH